MQMIFAFQKMSKPEHVLIRMCADQLAAAQEQTQDVTNAFVTIPVQTFARHIAINDLSAAEILSTLMENLFGLTLKIPHTSIYPRPGQTIRWIESYKNKNNTFTIHWASEIIPHLILTIPPF